MKVGMMDVEGLEKLLKGSTLSSTPPGNYDVPIPLKTTLEEFEQYSKLFGKNPFKEGQIVTPRPNSNLKWAGRPGLVVMSLKKPLPPNFSGNGNQEDGSCYNLRVAFLFRSGDRNVIATFWHEAHQFELYDPKKHSE